LYPSTPSNTEAVAELLWGGRPSSPPSSTLLVPVRRLISTFLSRQRKCVAWGVFAHLARWPGCAPACNSACLRARAHQRARLPRCVGPSLSWLSGYARIDRSWRARPRATRRGHNELATATCGHLLPPHLRRSTTTAPPQPRRRQRLARCSRPRFGRRRATRSPATTPCDALTGPDHDSDALAATARSLGRRQAAVHSPAPTTTPSVWRSSRRNSPAYSAGRARCARSWLPSSSPSWAPSLRCSPRCRTPWARARTALLGLGQPWWPRSRHAGEEHGRRAPSVR
jgi:hypothetical protein